ncbi:MAG: hypothetical protein FWE36_03700 [Erysipelotrichales bacterium]|nr:hypothetical protein [Erysipelotrichales bacterium]
MINKVDRSKFRRIALIVVILAFGLTLTACRGQRVGARVGITDDIYATSGNFSVTQREMFDAMLFQKTGFNFLSPNSLRALQDELVFSPWIAEINFDGATVNRLTEVREGNKDIDSLLIREEREVFNLVLQGAYGTDDLREINRISGSQRRTVEQRFVDSFVARGILVDPRFDSNRNSHNIFDLQILNSFRLELARSNFARAILEDDVQREFLLDDRGRETEIRNPNYISEDDIENRFDVLHENRNPLDAIIIRFANLEEANQTMRLFGDSSTIDYDFGPGNYFRGLKSYKNRWYLIPQCVAGTAGNPRECTTQEAIEWFDNYRVDSRVDVSLDSIDNGRLLLIEFVKIYMYIYSFRTSIDQAFIDYLYGLPTVEAVREAILNIDDSETSDLYFFRNRFRWTFDDLDRFNSSLRSFIYSSLRVDPPANVSGVFRYTSAPRSYGDNVFLVYKLTDAELSDFNDEMRQTIWDELFEERLTASYITQQVNRLMELVTLTIFDPDLDLMFSLSNRLHPTTRQRSNEFIARIVIEACDDLHVAAAEYNITPLAFFQEMERINGRNIASSLLTERILRAPETGLVQRITTDDIRRHREAFEVIMRNFSNDFFAFNGLPASMGRQAFLRLYFQAETLEEAFVNSFEANAVLDIFLEDLISADGMNERFLKYSDILYNSFYDVTLHHFLIYIDMDEDGEPDNPQDFLDTLNPTELANFQERVFALMAQVHDFTRNSRQSHVNAFNEIINNLNQSTRFTPDPESCRREPHQLSCVWAEFKRDGLLVRTEDLGSITNVSALNFDEDFIDQLDFMRFAENGRFHGQFMQELGTDFYSLTQSRFGWHLLVATSHQTPVSAQFLERDDRDDDGYPQFSNVGIFNSEGELIERINAYNTGTAPSLNQVRIYMAERHFANGVENLPGHVIQALDTWFRPVIDRFENSISQSFILRSILMEQHGQTDGITFASSNNQQLFARTFEVSVHMFTEYQFIGREDLNPWQNWFQDFFNFSLA